MAMPQEMQVEGLTTKEVQAIKNLQSGQASEYDQKLALLVIVNKFSRVHDVLYIPSDTHATAFLNGRAHVGAQIMKCLKLPIGAITIDGVTEDVPATKSATKRTNRNK